MALKVYIVKVCINRNIDLNIDLSIDLNIDLNYARSEPSNYILGTFSGIL